MVEVVPPPGGTVRILSRVRIFFSEPVRGFDASDIRINGIPPTSVEGYANGPWQLDFKEVTKGTVNISWSDKHFITDKAPQPNRFLGNDWSYIIEAAYRPGSVVINEFLVSKQDGLSDEDGETSDWIELKNIDQNTVDLTGWSLTDDKRKPGKWVFPSVSIAAEGYMVVFASGKNRRASKEQLHTNFKLNSEGEFLGLFSPELPRSSIDKISPRYPEQLNGYSYGLLKTGKRVYFSEPTPGNQNKTGGIKSLLGEPFFSKKNGFFNIPFSVSIASPELSSMIRYTTDCSKPTETHGKVYQGPIKISQTTVLRAVVFADDAMPSRVVTKTYVYEDSEAITSLPLLSLVTGHNNLWGDTGIMERKPPNTTKRGIMWERPVSVELLIPGKTKIGFQIDCGLRIQGGDYIRHNYIPHSKAPTGKYSFRLYFRGSYGADRLKYPFFPGLPVEEFEHIVLRAGMNDPINPFIVDELIRRLNTDMGQASSQGTIVNLYLNGKYQGYYNPVERIDSNFLRSRHGGRAKWDVIAQRGEIHEGNAIEWNRLKRTVIGPNLSIPDNYTEVTQQLDIDNFIDYIMLNVYADMDDWPDNNWRAARERSDRSKWRFYIWDGERSFGTDGKSMLGTLSGQRWPQKRTVISNNLTMGSLAGSSDIARIFRSLVKNPDFRLRFADRVQKHYFNGGALTDKNISHRHSELRDTMKGVLPRMNPYIENQWIPNRQSIVMGQMASIGIQRSENAPNFSRHGGEVPVGYRLSIAASTGKVYYTLDGDDPRKLSTKPNLVKVYKTPFVINKPVTVKARTLVNGQWSALTEAAFFPEYTLPLIRITEVMYNPLGGNEYEFVELLNTSDVETDLRWFKFKGIDFTFGMEDLIGPRKRIVLASNANPDAFARRYPRLQVYGWFGGSLANSGEKLALQNANGDMVISVEYDDGDAWPSLADGDGYSLEIIDPLGNANSQRNWAASMKPGGTPGRNSAREKSINSP